MSSTMGMNTRVSLNRVDEVSVELDAEPVANLFEDRANNRSALTIYDPLRAIQEISWTTEMREAMKACGNTTATYWIQDAYYTLDPCTTEQKSCSDSPSLSTQSAVNIKPFLRDNLCVGSNPASNGPHQGVSSNISCDGYSSGPKSQNLRGYITINIERHDGTQFRLVIASTEEGQMAVICPNCALEHQVDLLELLANLSQIHAVQDSESLYVNLTAQEPASHSPEYLVPSMSASNASSSRNVSCASQHRLSPARRIPGAYPSSDGAGSSSSYWATTIDSNASLSNSSWITTADSNASANVHLGPTCKVS